MNKNIHKLLALVVIGLTNEISLAKLIGEQSLTGSTIYNCNLQNDGKEQGKTKQDSDRIQRDRDQQIERKYAREECNSSTGDDAAIARTLQGDEGAAHIRAVVFGFQQQARARRAAADDNTIAGILQRDEGEAYARHVAFDLRHQTRAQRAAKRAQRAAKRAQRAAKKENCCTKVTKAAAHLIGW